MMMHVWWVFGKIEIDKVFNQCCAMLSLDWHIYAIHFILVHFNFGFPWVSGNFNQWKLDWKCL